MEIHRIEVQSYPTILLVISLYFTGGYQTRVCVHDTTHPLLSVYLFCIYRLLDFARRSHVTVKILHKEYFRSIVFVYGEQSKCPPQTCSLSFLLNWIICQFGSFTSLRQLSRKAIVAHRMTEYAKQCLPPVLSDIYFVRYTLGKYPQDSPSVQRSICLGLFTERSNGRFMLLSTPGGQRLKNYLLEYFREMINEKVATESLRRFYRCECHVKLNTLRLHYLVASRMSVWLNAQYGIVPGPIRRRLLFD